MKSKIVSALIVALFPGLVVAQGTTSYECSFENLQRRIEILTEPGVTVPCEVHYYKDSESPGEKQVLWTATSEVGFCETKTMEFVAKLREWGWQCNSTAAPQSPVAEPEADDSMSDDTSDLDPAELDPAEQAQ